MGSGTHTVRQVVWVTRPGATKRALQSAPETHPAHHDDKCSIRDGSSRYNEGLKVVRGEIFYVLQRAGRIRAEV